MSASHARRYSRKRRSRLASGASITGVIQVRAKLKAFGEKFPHTLGAAMRQEAEIEATEAKRRTPVDTGALRASVHAEGPFFDGKTIYAAIVAGGPSAPYAIFVHENLEAHHTVGQAKFIESVIMESKSYILQRIANRVKLSGMGL